MTDRRDPAPTRPRRGHPIFSRFILTGAVVGVILLTGVAMASESINQPDHATYSLGRVLMFFGVIGAMLGALGGAIVALLLDRRS